MENFNIKDQDQRHTQTVKKGNKSTYLHISVLVRLTGGSRQTFD